MRTMVIKAKAAGLVKFLSVVILLLSSVGMQAQGGVPSVPAGGSARPSSSGSDSKPLPWKFLASPAGAIAADVWKNDETFAAACDDPKNCAVPFKQVEDLIGRTLGTPKQGATEYVVIHVFYYGDTMSDGWYLYRAGKGTYGEPKWNYEKFVGQRIYGSPTVMFLFFHVGAQGMSLSHARDQLQKLVHTARADYATADSKAPAGADHKVAVATELQKNNWDPDVATVLGRDLADADVENALQGLKKGEYKVGSTTLRFCAADGNTHFKWLGDFAIPDNYLNVHYEAAVVRRTPANIDHLKAIAGLLFGAQSKDGCVPLSLDEPIVIWGTGRIDKIGLPSDVTIVGYAKEAGTALTDAERGSLALGTQETYNDEQLYWWDASIGIPVHKIKDLQYSDTDNTVTARQVDKQSAYAMFDLMIHPVDLSDPSYNVWPRILVGFPLASDPWDKLFAGGAVGLPLKPFRNFQFFAGATFLRTQQPAALAAGDPATGAQLQNDLRIKMTPKFTFGINVPVLSVIQKLKGGS